MDGIFVPGLASTRVRWLPESSGMCPAGAVQWWAVWDAVEFNALPAMVADYGLQCRDAHNRSGDCGPSWNGQFPSRAANCRLNRRDTMNIFYIIGVIVVVIVVAGFLGIHI
jgi:hypothetical protein